VLPEVLLGLSVHTPLELPGWARPTLVIERDAAELLYTPRVAGATPVRSRGPEQWLWRGIFPVPRELASDSDALFTLRLFDDLRLALPAPFELSAAEISSGDDGPGRSPRSWPYVVRRTALLFVVTAQLCLVPALQSPSAVAARVAGSAACVEAVPKGATPPSTGEPSAPCPEGPPAPPAGGSGEKPVENQLSSPEQPASPPAGPPSEPKPETPAQPSGNRGRESTPPPAAAASAPVAPVQPSSPRHQRASSPHAAAPDTGRRSKHGVLPADPDSSRHSGGQPHARREQDGAIKHGVAHEPGAHKGRLGKHQGHSQPHQRPSEPSRAAAAPAGQEMAAAIAPAPEAAEVSPLLLRLPPGLEGLGADSPPAYLIPIYQEAGSRYNVPWRVLAAINQIETDYGRNLSVSSAGALGWMQFMPETWSRWAVDADHDGQLNPYSPLDAIFTAARYLQASGAESDLPGAILAYNHAQWYVSEVLMRARMLEGNLTATGSEKGYALPLDAPYMDTLGRTDDGVDIETAPDGALVYSITPGVVTAVASDPSGFGPNYPVVEATSGTLAGADIYYGHVARALVTPGQHVAAGQPIAVMGHTGDAVSLGHGHIEIGFSSASGDPLNHHGAGAWTPAGEVMRSFLVTLTSAFHAHARDAHAVAARARAARAHARRHSSQRRRRPGVEFGL
jgi:murein DD-endopeptidase MepM/ murein hydrolase activator NlpD